MYLKDVIAKHLIEEGTEFDDERTKNMKIYDKEREEIRKAFFEAAEVQDDEDDLDEDFDPEEYDKMMKVAFGEEYYEKADDAPEFGSDMDNEGWASSESGDGFLAARERSLEHKIDSDLSNEDNEEEGEEHGSEDEQGKRKRKRKLSLYTKAKEVMMEEYYKLDYEDTIGDLKARFKYAKIRPNRYGLSTAEIMALDDKELNQFVSMKKLAPYTRKNGRYQIVLDSS
ncbi:Protein KRI1-like protein, partial [Cucurbita argyrosperma subsp. argyrosperma]